MPQFVVVRVELGKKVLKIESLTLTLDLDLAKLKINLTQLSDLF